MSYEGIEKNIGFSEGFEGNEIFTSMDSIKEDRIFLPPVLQASAKYGGGWSPGPIKPNDSFEIGLKLVFILAVMILVGKLFALVSSFLSPLGVILGLYVSLVTLHFMK